MSDRTVKEKDKNKNEAQQKCGPSKSSENIANDTFLKRYKVIEKIGEGSYSEVLKCQNRSDGSITACKRLKHIYKSWSQVNEIAEIATLKTIQRHTNILQMIEIHYDERLGKVSLVFELMDVNLYELIKDRKRLLPESRVRTIMFQLFRALRHLHKLGIFHRDIKPENILIKLKTDQLKLGDLGSVRGMFSRPPYTEYISTRWYRSPECLLTAGHYSHKMDVWAAGCVFYEVLTLRPLFPGSSEIDQINRINNILGPPPVKLLETFQKQSDLERDSYKNQTQMNRRTHIQKVLDGYSSKYLITNESNSKTLASKPAKSSKNNMEFYFAGKEGSGLDKILPSHITREAKDIIRACLSYDPEQRPPAQRIIQLSYFYELRENIAKNPEKMSSKPIITICGETITDHLDCIDLGTLGDKKAKRYHRGVPQRASKESSHSNVYPKSSSKIEINNNKFSSSTNNSIGSVSDISHIPKASKTNNKPVHNSKDRSVASSHGKIRYCRSKLNAEQTSSKPVATKLKHKDEMLEDKKHGKSTSYESVRSNQQNHKVKQIQQPNRQKGLDKTNSKLDVIRTIDKMSVKKSKFKGSDESFDSVDTKLSKESESCTTASKHENRRVSNSISSNLIQTEEKVRKSKAVSSQIIASKVDDMGKDMKKAGIPTDLSPYVKAPSELKFLQKKIKTDSNNNTTSINTRKSTKENLQISTQPQQPQLMQMFAVRPQQVTKQDTGKVSVVPPKVAAAAIKYVSSVNKQSSTSASVARQLRDALGDAPTASSGNGAYSPDESSYATSSVKIGKLRFRQKPQMNADNEGENIHPSRIPLLVDDTDTRKVYKSTKLTSPIESRYQETDKWRNTGIPRIIPMSPERERNIKLIRESLTMDKNKRLKIRQDAMNNNIPHANNYGYGTNASKLDALKQPQRVSEAYSSGRYLNSTTDYENPDVQETCSSAAPVESSIFNSRSTRITLPDLAEEIKKPMKANELYPEIIDIYSSRFRGPDVNMNILNDGNYVVHQERSHDVKEKINYRIQARRQQNSSSVGDHPGKLTSERNSNYNYGSYSTNIGNSRGMGMTSMDEQSRHGRNPPPSKLERRPPVPPVKLSLRHTDVNKSQRHYREQSPDGVTLRGGPPYNMRRSNRAQEIPLVKNPRRPTDLRKEFKDTKRRVERMKSTMRDDVFCSSDDDVVMTIRKKFDNLISERARKLSESLKTNPVVDSANEIRKPCDSRSEDDLSSKRTKNDKPKKYARRELRARMAESLTSNNYLNWNSERFAGRDLRISHALLENASNSGDYVKPTYGNSALNGRSSDVKLKYNPDNQYQSELRANRNTYEDDNYKYPSSRIYQYPHHDRRGQMYTPPGNKPVYQSSQLGAVLQERKLRYSHNSPAPISSHSNYSPRRNIKEQSIKKRQRI